MSGRQDRHRGDNACSGRRGARCTVPCGPACDLGCGAFATGASARRCRYGAHAAGALPNDVRALSYGTDRFAPGLSPPPPLPPPTPLAPGPNDGPWVHGGDRRLSSIASAGLKQKLVAAAIVEMERNGQHTAGRLVLQHYLDSSGEAETLSAAQVDAWLADAADGYGPLDPASVPALLVQSNLNTITGDALAEARRTGHPVTVTGNTPWAVVPAATATRCAR